MHVIIFHVGKHKRHFSNSVQLPYEPLTTQPQRVLRYQAEGSTYAVQGYREPNFRNSTHTQGRGLDKTGTVTGTVRGPTIRPHFSLAIISVTTQFWT